MILLLVTSLKFSIQTRNDALKKINYFIFTANRILEFRGNISVTINKLGLPFEFIFSKNCKLYLYQLVNVINNCLERVHYTGCPTVIFQLYH